MLKWHGWYKTKTISYVNGYNVNTPAPCEDTDCFIHIDTKNSKNHATISTLRGTLWHLHNPAKPIASDSKYFLLPGRSNGDVLVSEEWLKCPHEQNAVFELFTPILQYFDADEEEHHRQRPQILVTCDAGWTEQQLPTRHPSFIPMAGGPQWLEKIDHNDVDELPAMVEDAIYHVPQWNRGHSILAMFQYIFHRLYHFIATTSDANRDLVPTFSEAQAVFRRYLEPPGRRFQTPIRKIWTTRHQSGVTEIFTDGFAFATMGSTIQLRGLNKLNNYNNSWKSVDDGGPHKNAVSILHFADIPNPSSAHVDTKTRDSKIVWCFDSTGFPDLILVNNNYNNKNSNQNNHVITTRRSSGLRRRGRGGEIRRLVEADDPAVVEVVHLVHEQMEYPEFIAAIQAMQYDIFGVSQHTAYSTWLPRHNHRLPSSWDQLEQLLRSNQAVSVPSRWRVNRVYASLFYHNPVDSSDMRLMDPGEMTSSSSPSSSLIGLYPKIIPVYHLNDPVMPVQEIKPGGYMDYHIVINNYLQDPKNLYWRIAPGSKSHLPIHSMLTQLGNYNSPGSEFEGAAVSMFRPPTDRSWTLFGMHDEDDEDEDGGNPSDNNRVQARTSKRKKFVVPQNVRFHSAQLRLYADRIRPEQCHGKSIGYLRISSFDLCDPMLFQHDIRFGDPDIVHNSPRLGSENFCGLFAELMRSIQPHKLDGMVVSIEGNRGGLCLAAFIASFFGDDRSGLDGTMAVCAPDVPNSRQMEHNAVQLYEDAWKQNKLRSFGSILEKSENITQKVYVRETIRLYGRECVFQNGPLVIMTDECCCSEGDLFPQFFLGDRFDRNIGADTQVFLIGEIDGKIKGGVQCDFTTSGLPLFNFELKNANGVPMNAVPVSRIENAAAGLSSINGRPTSIQSQETAIDGGPLPNNFAHTVWPDIGLTNRGGGSTAIDFNDRSTWRYSWLDHAINVILQNLPKK